MSSTEVAWGVLGKVVKKFSIAPDSSAFVPLVEYGTSFLDFTSKIENQKLTIFQTFKSDVNAFHEKAMSTTQVLPAGSFENVYFVPSRQRIESLGLLAFSLLNLSEHGRLFFCCQNQLGAGGYVTRFKDLFPNVEIESSQKCRWLLLTYGDIQNTGVKEKLKSWIEEASSSVVPGTGLKSFPGIYGWNKVDRGSELLMSSLPQLTGVGADLGSGYGFLAHEIHLKSYELKHIYIVEAEKRALDCAVKNLELWKEKTSFHWLDVCAPELQKEIPPLDWIVMNPPFHEGAEVRQDLGKEFISAAASLLKKGGKLYLVANAFLPYEDVLKSKFKSFYRVVEQDGFKVISAER